MIRSLAHIDCCCAHCVKSFDARIEKWVFAIVRTVILIFNRIFLFPACEGLHVMEPLEYVYSPLSLVLHSLSLAWLAKVSQTERSHASTFDLYYNLTVSRTLLLGFLCVLHPDGPKALIYGNWHSLLFLGYMLGMLLLGAVQLLFVDVTALYLSALPAAVLHATRGLVQPLFSLL